MSQAPNDGGPAFSMAERDDALRGMSLRDYFAAKAMAAMLSIYEVHHNAGETEVAEWAYQQADAMLEIRAERAGGAA